MKHTFKPLKAKTDDSGIHWQVCECARCGLLRRQTDQNGWNFTRTLYHRRGRTHADGSPYWSRYLKDERRNRLRRRQPTP